MLPLAVPAIAEEGNALPALGDQDGNSAAAAAMGWPARMTKLSPYPLTFHIEAFALHVDDLKLGQPDGLNIGDIIEVSHCEEWYEQFSPEIRPPKLILQVGLFRLYPSLLQCLQFVRIPS